jgi:hypothetical protein
MRALTAALTGIFVLGSTVSGCFEAGANFNQQAPGNNDSGGVDLGGTEKWNPDPANPDTTSSMFYGAVAVAPSGDYFLSRAGTDLIHGDLTTGGTRLVGVAGPRKIAFASKASRFYVTTDAGSVHAVEPASLKVIWNRSTALGPDVKIYASKDDKHLVAAGVDTIKILDAATGQLTGQLSAGLIQDVDISPDSAAAIVTLQHSWPAGAEAPETRILLVDLKKTGYSEITVPNCSSPLVLTPDGTKAFLAPTHCINPNSSYDPVSVIDLVAKKWVRNLPGFGPVAMATDGVTAVAFMDAQNLDMTLFDDPAQAPSAANGRYHMMLLDTSTLKFHSVPLGDDLPRYTMTPDGQVVLVDLGGFWQEAGIRLLDVKTRKIHGVSGPVVKLDHFVVSPNSSDVYLLYYADLYWLSIPQRTVKHVPAAPLGWQAMNITPGGEQLLLLDSQGTLHLYDIPTETIVHSMTPP